jgi:hypothetical protein
MAVFTKIVSSIFVVLFIEAILFGPVVLLIAIFGSEIVRVLKYTGLCLVALIPYIIRKRAKGTVSITWRNTVFMAFGAIASICFFVWFTLLMLASFAGHPSF